MAIRDAHRADVTARILAAARREIAEQGGGGLSMRAVAREVGIVSSAIYRYFPSREALLTAMIVESYDHLRAALDAAGPQAPWADLAHAFRAWARGSVHEFQLIYGTPVPGYVAPPETIPAALAVAERFLQAGRGTPPASYASTELGAQLGELAALTATTPASAGAVLAELAALVGVVTLELSGHFVGTADPADALFAALVARQEETLGVARP